jgi:hypothetical protein
MRSERKICSTSSPLPSTVLVEMQLKNGTKRLKLSFSCQLMTKSRLSSNATHDLAIFVVFLSGFGQLNCIFMSLKQIFMSL